MKNLLILIPAAWLLLSGCYSTKVESSWRDPNTTIVSDSVRKGLSVALVKNEGVRRQMEDQISKSTKGRIAPSYNYLMDVAPGQEKELTEKMYKDGYDMIIIMRLVDVQESTTYVPGSTYPSYYGGWHGYYGYSYPMYTSPGYVTTDHSYKVETTFYKLPENKLVYSAITSTLNPNDVESAIDDIAYALKTQMRKEGFLK